MKSKRIFRIITVVTVGLFLASIGVRTRLHQKLQLKKVVEHATVISESLWSFNPDIAKNYLQLACDANHYQRIVVTVSSDQEFITLEAPRDKAFDRFFKSVSLIRTVPLKAEVFHDKTVIGEIAVEWVDTAIYGYLVELLIIALLLTVFGLFLATLKQKGALESRVAARTAELQKEMKEHSLAETTLRKNEQRLRLSTEMAGVAVWEYDMGQNQMSRSGNHDALYGLDWQEVWTVDTFLNAVHPDDRERSNRIIQQSIEAGGPDHYLYDFRVVWADQSLHWLSLVGEVAERDTAGVATLVRGCLIDITERKRTEVALLESEERAQLMADLVTNSDQPVAVGFPDGRLARFNPAFCELVGYTEEEIQALDWAVDLTPPEWRPAEREVLAQLEHSGKPVRYEKEYIRKDGSRVPIELFVHLNHDPEGEPDYYFAFITDITERKRAEEAALARERQYRNVNQTTSDGFWRVDRNLRILEVNSAYCEMSGYSEQELLTLSIPDLDATETSAESQTRAAAIFEAGTGRFETRHRRKDGSEFDVEIITESDSNKDEFFVFIRDITDRKQAEEELRASEEWLLRAQSAGRVGIWSIDLINDTMQLTEAAARLHGLTAGHYTLEELYGTVPPEDEPHLKKAFEATVKTGAPFNIEHRIINVNTKEVTWIDSRGERVCDENGTPILLTGTAVDITERKRAEEKLQASEIQFRALFEQAGDYCMILDPNTEDGIPLIVDANKAACTMHGYTHEELMGRPVAELDDEEGRRLCREHTQQIMSGEPFFVENRHVRKDGTTFYVAVHANRIDIEGQPPLIFTTEYDITARKQAEENLRRESSLLVEAQKIAHLGVFELITAKQTIEWSEEEYRIYGLDPAGPSPSLETLLAKSILPEDADMMRETVTQAIQRKEVFELEHRIVRPDGMVRWVYDRALPTIDAQGDLECYIGITLDITERKLIENKLQESRGQLRLMFEQAPMPMCMNSFAGEFLSVNSAYERLTGYTANELLGMTLLDITHPDDRPRNKDHMKDISADQVPAFEMEKRYLRKDGSEIVVMVHATSVHDAEGVPLFGLAVVENITELKQAKEALLDSREQLEQRVEARTVELKARKDEAETLNRGMVNLLQDLQTANRDLAQAEQTLLQTNQELESFSYSVSHDLRAPLRHIDGFVSLLLKREGERLDATSARYLETIAQSSGRMGNLIDDLLDFSRTGRAAMHFQKINSNKIVQSVIAELTPMVQDRCIDWKISDLPPVVADSTLLRQVWSNLIGNAVKYTGLREKACIEIGTLGQQDDAVPEENIFYVRDNGAGFDPQYTHKLFGVFQRLHRNDEFEGTGIGLATVQRIVLRHGGRVWAEGRVNEGATFYFTLEANKGAER